MLSMRIGLLAFVCVVVTLWMLPAVASADEAATKRARAFVDSFTKRIRPLEIAAGRAWWEANMTGKKEAYKAKEEAQNQLDAVLADKQQFADVKAIKAAGKLRVEGRDYKMRESDVAHFLIGK